MRCALRIEYNITVEDLKALKLRQYKKTNQSFMAISIRFIVTMSLAFIALKAYDDYQNFGSFYFLAVTGVFGLAATLFFAFYYVIREYFFLRRFTRLSETPAYKAILGQQSIDVGNQVFRFEKDDFHNEMNAPFIKQISEDEQMVYLQIDTQNAYLIPKRAFVSQNEMMQFHEILKPYIIK